MNYNNIMRKLEGVPLMSSASQMFATRNVKSFSELLRGAAYGMMQRVINSGNTLVIKLLSSNVFLNSPFFRLWWKVLCIP